MNGTKAIEILFGRKNFKDTLYTDWVNEFSLRERPDKTLSYDVGRSLVRVGVKFRSAHNSLTGATLSVQYEWSPVWITISGYGATQAEAVADAVTRFRQEWRRM